jgi:hypothetical protein
MLAFSLFDVDLRRVAEVFRQARGDLIVVAILPGAVLIRLLMAYKWNLLLRSAGISIPFVDVLAVYLISGFVGAFLPASVGGDLSRFYYLYRWQVDPFESLASIVVERFLGLVAVVVFALAAIPLILWRYPALSPLAWLAAILAVGCGLLLYLAFHPAVAAGLARLIPKFARRSLQTTGERAYRAIHAYRHRPRVLARFFALTLLQTAIGIGLNVVVAEALGLAISWTAIWAVTPFILLLVRIPLSIGVIGVAEFSFVYFFTLAGTGADQALAFGIACDAIDILTALPGAALLLLYRRRAGTGRDEKPAIAQSVDGPSGR